MKRIIIKGFVFMLIPAVLCSGCGNKPESGKSSFGKQEVIKYKSGAIMLKTNDVYNMADQEPVSEEERHDREEIDFGPGNPEFGN